MAQVETNNSQYRWDACHRNLWDESNIWTEFAQHWRTQEISYDTVSRLTLVPEELQNAPILGDMFGILSNNKEMLVLDEYRIMMRRIFERYNDTLQGDSGCVITGQPGVECSTMFLLVVLLQSKEPTPIVFYHEKGRVVFFENKAYVERNPASFSIYTIPLPKDRPKFPESIPHTWVLIDMGDSMEEPQLDSKGYIFPVQSAPPNPVRYRHWLKKFRSEIWVFPLWTMDQIHTGWTTQYKYPHFRARVQDWMNKTIPESDIRTFTDHTNIVQTHLDQCPMVSHTSGCVDEVIIKCVDWAIERFGYSPRDVYSSFEDPSMAKDLHDSAVHNALASWESAADFVRRFDETGEAYTNDLDPGRVSHPIVALDISRADFNSGRGQYAIVYTWKSPSVQKAMMDNYHVLTEEQQARYYRIIQTSAKGSVIARPIYEPRAHEYFTSKEKCFLPLQPMHKTKSYDNRLSLPLTYVTTTDPAAFYPDLPYGLKLQEYGTNINSIPILEGRYYKPNYESHPLFDSFIIEKSNGSVFLNIIQFGLPDNNTGAMSGYDIIDKLRLLVNKEFGLPVRIRYVYASSELLPNWIPKTWQLPRTGFIEGEVWYLGLPYPFERETFQEAERVLKTRQRQKELDQMQEQTQEQTQVNRKKREQQELFEEETEDEKPKEGKEMSD